MRHFDLSIAAIVLLASRVRVLAQDGNRSRRRHEPSSRPSARTRMKRCIVGLAALVLATGQLQAAGPLNEQQARAKAVKILMGDPYGTTTGQVLKTIKDAQLVRDGKTACGEKKRPVWRFHVVVETPVNNPTSPINGYLYLDATGGEIVCANLPMLD